MEAFHAEGGSLLEGTWNVSLCRPFTCTEYTKKHNMSSLKKNREREEVRSNLNLQSDQKLKTNCRETQLRKLSIFRQNNCVYSCYNYYVRVRVRRPIWVSQNKSNVTCNTWKRAAADHTQCKCKPVGSGFLLNSRRLRHFPIIAVDCKMTWTAQCSGS